MVPGAPANQTAPPSAGSLPLPEPRRVDLTRTVIAVLLIVLLIAAPFWILKPFLGAIVWATILAVATWPGPASASSIASRRTRIPACSSPT
jgi:hypothetical protein